MLDNVANMRPVPEYSADEDMPLERRQARMKDIEALRGGRRLVVLANLDRTSDPKFTGLATNFSAELKEPLYRVLKETVRKGQGIDLLLYTRGGDTNAVWPLVSLLREFDPDFEVLVPFRCHSGGTLLALAAQRIVMSRIGELSPIDPTTGNQFNPVDPLQSQRMGISVEDVRAYRDFILEQFRLSGEDGKATKDTREALGPFLGRLTDQVHPLALGNVHRVHQQIKTLADKLLSFHHADEQWRNKVVDSLTTRSFSHLHMVSREEARGILGDAVVYADDKLDAALDSLLRGYEVHFFLRRDFYLAPFIKDQPRTEARFIGGVVESVSWSYLHETEVVILQSTAFPQNVQVQVPAGQPLPLLPGLPRNIRVDVASKGWVRNTGPKGFSR